MREFINKKMYEVFEDFKMDVEKMGRLCELKKCRFDGSNTPDYRDPVIQRLYLLRYLPAYIVEYYLMYKDVFETRFLGKNINVLSFGMGCGLDFWGLKYARDKFAEDVDISYTGLDVVDWNYWDDIGENNTWFIHQNIDNLKELDDEDYNIIIFSKSIGELSRSSFWNLEKIIENTHFVSDKIMLLSSVRKSRTNIDISRVEDLAKIFTNEHNYKCLDDSSECWYYDNTRLEYECDEFTYPNEIRDYLLSLSTRCTGFLDNLFESCYSDCKDMNRCPVTRTSQIQYQVLRLKR